MGLFRAVLAILFTGLFFYVTHQLTRFADLGFPAIALVLGLILVLFGLVLSLPLFFWSSQRNQYKAWHDPFLQLIHASVGYLNFLILFVIIRDVLAFINHFITPNYISEINWYNSTGLVVLLVLPLLCLILGTLVVQSGPRLKKLRLKFADLPHELEGLRLLHITDLHISRSLPTSFVKKLVRLGEKHPADVVVFTGDILDDNPHRFQDDLQLLKKIPNKYGSYYVPGNHEYYWEGQNTIPEFRKLGFNVLTNECHSLNIGDAELQICGVPDPAARIFSLEHPDFEKLERALHKVAFKVLLSHQPTLADEAAPLGIDLQLSGHTHGGQFFPWNVLIGFFEKYGKGLYHIQNLQLYVNQGTGYWGPSLRLGTYCEVAEITLTKK